MRTCSDEAEGPEICNTYYETACETTYKTYEVEQDEPVCRMEIMTKCEDVKCKCIFFGKSGEKKIRLTDVNFFLGKKELSAPVIFLERKQNFFFGLPSSNFFLL